jgi:Ca2+-binding RTX toxin-like protein
VNAPDFEDKADKDGDGIYVVDVTVTDDKGAIDTQEISVTIKDVNPEILTGTSEPETLTAGKGNYHIFGEGGADTITGNTGNDTLDGGDGADQLTGGAGSNTFHYANISEAGDTIADFKTGIGNDVLDIKDLLQGYDGSSDLEATGFVQLVDNGGKTAVQVDVDGGADNFVTLATLSNVNSGTVTVTDLVTDGNLVAHS